MRLITAVQWDFATNPRKMRKRLIQTFSLSSWIQEVCSQDSATQSHTYRYHHIYIRYIIYIWWKWQLFSLTKFFLPVTVESRRGLSYGSQISCTWCFPLSLTDNERRGMWGNDLPSSSLSLVACKQGLDNPGRHNVISNTYYNLQQPGWHPVPALLRPKCFLAVWILIHKGRLMVAMASADGSSEWCFYSALKVWQAALFGDHNG